MECTSVSLIILENPSAQLFGELMELFNHLPLAARSAALAATERAAEEPNPDAVGICPSILIDNGGALRLVGHNRCFSASI